MTEIQGFHIRGPYFKKEFFFGYGGSLRASLDHYYYHYTRLAKEATGPTYSHVGIGGEERCISSRGSSSYYLVSSASSLIDHRNTRGSSLLLWPVSLL